MALKLRRSSILLITILFKASLVLNLNFNRDIFGVEFSPYIMGTENGQPSIRQSTYTFENVKTMMRIVSTKFTRVVIRSVDANSAPYKKNHSYYYEANVRARTAEAAALINRENNNKSLTVMIGAWNYGDWNDNTQWDTEIHVAVEAAQIANSIFSGTVEGIFLARHHLQEPILNGLSLLIAGPDKPAGVDETGIELWTLRKQIVLMSDIIICTPIPLKQFAIPGAKYGFLSISENVLGRLAEIKSIKPELDVMWLTHSPGDENDWWNTVENFRDYWEDVNRMTNEKGYKVYLSWAFELPNGTENRRGWSKLENDSYINNASGYVEVISGNPVDLKETKREPDISVESGNVSWWLIGLLIFASCAIVVVVIMWIRKYSRPKYLTRHDVKEFRVGIANYCEEHKPSDYEPNIPALSAPYDNALEIPKSRLNILWNQPLGEGNFVFVFKAILKNNGNDREIAVKMTRPPDCATFGLMGILAEIKILKYLGPHPNIVSICGAYTKEIVYGVVYLAMDLCQLGSLRSYLRAKATAQFAESSSVPMNNGAEVEDTVPLSDMVRWSYEIACGMAHLEKMNVIHADLSTKNVLLNSERIAKITDFAVSRRSYAYAELESFLNFQEPQFWRWFAIESLKRAKFSLKSDVWSYGVTLWEIFSLGDLPFSDKSWSLDFIEAVENGLRLGQPRNASDEIYQVMRNCWQLMPEDRPTFAELRNSIKLHLEGNQIQFPSELIRSAGNPVN